MKLMLLVIAWMVLYLLAGRPVSIWDIVIWGILFSLGLAWKGEK